MIRTEELARKMDEVAARCSRDLLKFSESVSSRRLACIGKIVSRQRANVIGVRGRMISTCNRHQLKIRSLAEGF